MQKTGFSLWIACPLHDKEKVGQWLNLIAHSSGLQFPKKEATGGLLGKNKATDSEDGRNVSLAPAGTHGMNDLLRLSCVKLFRLPGQFQ